MARKGENIYKRKDGRWEGRYIKARSADGKITFGYLYAKKYTDLKKKLAIKKSEFAYLDRDSDLYQGTVKDWLNYWLDFLISRKIKASTYSNYRGRMDKHIFPYLGSIPLAELDHQKLEHFIHHLTGLGLSPKTIHCIVNIVKSALHRAMIEGKLLRDPSISLILPSIQKTKISALSEAEQQQLENEALKEADCSAVILSLYTGMRIGEISALRWQDIDFEQNRISVERTLQRISVDDGQKTEIIFSTPKTGSSIRSIPLAANLKAYLLAKKEAAATEFVVECRGGYAEPRVINYRFKKLLEKAELPDVNFHVLRHTFATRCVEQRVDIATLSKLLGHTSIKLTLDTYTDSMWENRQKAVMLLDSRLKKTTAA